jgi:hypothetical protein
LYHAVKEGSKKQLDEPFGALRRPIWTGETKSSNWGGGGRESEREEQGDCGQQHSFQPLAVTNAIIETTSTANT